MTFRTWLADKKWLFYEKGLQAQHNRLHKFAEATSVGTFVAGAGMIGDIEMDAASNPGLTATVGIGTTEAGQQDLPKSTAGKITPDSAASIKAPPTQFRS